VTLKLPNKLTLENLNTAAQLKVSFQEVLQAENPKRGATREVLSKTDS
jgi:hypothetical protein